MLSPGEQGVDDKVCTQNANLAKIDGWARCHSTDY